MFKVKYYYRDKFLGEETFPSLEKAEESLYKSSFSLRGDYYEIIEQYTSKIVQEFIIPTYDLPLCEGVEPFNDQKPESLDWFDWQEESYKN